MMVGASEGVRSEFIVWFAFDKSALGAQYSAYRMEAGTVGLPSSFVALWATSLLLYQKA